MSSKDWFDGSLLKALGHPLRLRLLEMISEAGESSPVELARQLEVPLPTVSHHVRLLRDIGYLELTRTAPRRGAVEHFYRAVHRPFLDEELWEQLPLPLRRGIAGQIFQLIVTEASHAGSNGGFDDPRAHVDRLVLELDATGRSELSEALTSLLRRAEHIQADSDARRGDGDGVTVKPTTMVLLHYFVEPATPTGSGTEAPPPPERRPPLP